MKKMILSLVAAVMAFIPGNLKADNLADDSSFLTPNRQHEGKMIAVDVGLALILNRVAYAPGADKNSILQLKQNLEKASAEFKKIDGAANHAADVLKRKEAADWGKINQVMRDQRGIAKTLAEKNAKLAEMRNFAKDMRPDRQVAKQAFAKIAALEEEIAGLKAQHAKLGESIADVMAPNARKAALNLAAQRDEAARKLAEMSDDITKAQRLSNGMRVIRIVGNTALGLDALGHTWAFIDNSRQPVFFGGVQKLGQEVYDAMYAEVEKRAPTPAPIDVDSLPTRGSRFVPTPAPATHGSQTPAQAEPQARPASEVKPTEPTPGRKLPPLQKTRPTFPPKNSTPMS